MHFDERLIVKKTKRKKQVTSFINSQSKEASLFLFHTQLKPVHFYLSLSPFLVQSDQVENAKYPDFALIMGSKPCGFELFSLLVRGHFGSPLRWRRVEPEMSKGKVPKRATKGLQKMLRF